jgi:hypothetical protein
MPYLGWKGHCKQDKYNNITIATMNAAQRYGRNVWAMASYTKYMATTLMLFRDCGLAQKLFGLSKDKQWLHAYPQIVHSKSIIPVLKRFLRITKITRYI